MTGKNTGGNFVEDFSLGQTIAHATPRTLTEGDAALYTALYGSRFALQSSGAFARTIGHPRSPLDNLLVFNTIFGKSVSDISRNAIANLGYAEGRILKPVYPGTSLHARSEIIGLKENSSGESGVVYARTEGLDETGAIVLSYVRWVMVRKRDRAAKTAGTHVPQLQGAVAAETFRIPAHIRFEGYDTRQSGSPHLWDDFAPGEKIDHGDGMTMEEADHMLATRLYQNTARVHFDQFTESRGRFGKRLVYGGHVISLARALSFNGLANAISLLGINGGRHANPVFAGDTIFAWSEVKDKAPIPERSDCGALRLRLIAAKNCPCDGFPDKDAAGNYPDDVVLDFDYWALMPRRC